MSAKAKRAPAFDVADAIVKHQRAVMLGRVHYKRADHLMEQISKRVKPGRAIPLPGRKKAILKDNFANTNKVFRSHGINRYELEITQA